MTINLPDDLALLQFSEGELRLDLACGLYSAGRVSRGVATRIAGISAFEFDQELFRREIPSFTSQMFEQDLKTLERIREV